MPFRLLVLSILMLAAPLLSQSRVDLKASDGQPLVGRLYAPAGTAVAGAVLLPMYGSTQAAYASLAPLLADRGILTLALDLRGHGDSANDAEGRRVDVGRGVTEDPAKNPFLAMPNDARAALQALIEKGAPKERLAIVGASVGCSVALHTAVLEPELVRALVLLTPGTNYLGVPSLDHAPRYGDRPALILSSVEEADRGARALKALMNGPEVVLRLMEETGVHGTRMFGRVPAVEADIARWLSDVLLPKSSTEIPYDPNVLLDGNVEATEALLALRIPVRLEGDLEAQLRVCRTKTKLMLGVSIPERFMRRNAVTVFLETAADPPALPGASSWRVQIRPSLASDEAVLLSRGGAGSWGAGAASGAAVAHSSVRDKDRWSTELALSLQHIFDEDRDRPLRIGLAIQGAVEGKIRHYPGDLGAALESSPRAWRAFRLGPAPDGPR